LYGSKSIAPSLWLGRGSEDLEKVPKKLETSQNAKLEEWDAGCQLFRQRWRGRGKSRLPFLSLVVKRKGSLMKEYSDVISMLGVTLVKVVARLCPITRQSTSWKKRESMTYRINLPLIPAIVVQTLRGNLLRFSEFVLARIRVKNRGATRVFVGFCPCWSCCVVGNKRQSTQVCNASPSTPRLLRCCIDQRHKQRSR
jgi:hypothetical protein